MVKETYRKRRTAYARANRTAKTRADNAQRKRDKYRYEKKNWKLPKWYELDHTNGLKWGKVRKLKTSINRRLGVKKTAKIRKSRSKY